MMNKRILISYRRLFANNNNGMILSTSRMAGRLFAIEKQNKVKKGGDY